MDELTFGTGGAPWVRGSCDHDEHRGPQGPNEDMGWCYATGQPTYTMRPENEQIGLHADDCSLPRRHRDYCVGGGDGHPPTEIVRGYWPGMDADVAAARARFADSGSAAPQMDRKADHG